MTEAGSSPTRTAASPGAMPARATTSLTASATSRRTRAAIAFPSMICMARHCSAWPRATHPAKERRVGRLVVAAAEALQGGMGFKKAFITGASSGLGRGLSLHYARAGATVYAAARRRAELEALAAEAAAAGAAGRVGRLAVGVGHAVGV